MKMNETIPAMLFYDINKAIIPFGKIHSLALDESGDINGVEIETMNDNHRKIKFLSHDDFSDFFEEIFKQASAYFLEKALYSTVSSDLEYYKHKNILCVTLLRDFIKK